MVKENITKGLSIGYKVIKKTWKDGIRHLREIRLFEASVVTFPMNPEAVVTGVKSSGDDWLEESLKELRKEIEEILAS